LMYQINYWSAFFLWHSWDAGGRMGVQWGSTSPIHRLQGSL
jgi:hypothetical protein